MQIVTTTADIRTWVMNNNPGGILERPERVEPLVETLRASSHPAWGSDWEEWLNRTTSDEMPGTRGNPMPGATVEEIEQARAAWAAADILTQEERNAVAAHEGLVVERDATGYVVDK